MTVTSDSHRPPRTGPLLAETAIGRAAVAGVWAESVAMPGGQVSKRVLMGVKVKF